MSLSEREEQGWHAINDFVAQSCVFILPGGEPPPAPEVGSGTLLTTPNRGIVVLTAKHVAMDARRYQHSLGYFKCEDVMPDFVAGIVPHPEDVDVALLVVRQELVASLIPLAATPSSILDSHFELFNDDALVLNGFPYQASYFRSDPCEQGFKVLTYRCHEGPPPRDTRGRYRIPWHDIPGSGADVDLNRLSPGGMSGGPLWRFRKAPPTSVWSAGRIGVVVGVQSAWDEGDTLFVEPVEKWGTWFHDAIAQVDGHFK